MIIKIHKLELDEIANLKLSEFDFIKIESVGAEVDKLKLLNEILKTKNIMLVVSVDMREHSTDQKVKGIDVFKFLTNAKKININAVLTEPISSIEFLKNVQTIEYLSLDGYFNKNVDLSLMNKFENIYFFELLNGLSRQQHEMLKNKKKLLELRVSDLNLDLADKNENLKSLRIYNKFQNENLLSTKFSNLENLYVEKSKAFDLSKSVVKLKKLKSIWLRYMNHILSIPTFESKEKIILFQTTKLAKLEDIENIFEMTNLEALMMTELEVLKFESFRKLANLKNLKIAYVTFKSEIENKKFKAFALEQNWAYLQPALCEEKYDV
ncbi:hypothetical protein G6M26_30725 [Agrobacterium tumefaciens]|nr:hypothetical protein [Agrobacterium tumefaciens]NTE22926.1 hypothetical protein [Agrobacterium tumefaciens]